jgi:hypothetical protein
MPRDGAITDFCRSLSNRNRIRIWACCCSTLAAAGLVASRFSARCMRSCRPFYCGCPGLIRSIGPSGNHRAARRQPAGRSSRKYRQRHRGVGDLPAALGRAGRTASTCTRRCASTPRRITSRRAGVVQITPIAVSSSRCRAMRCLALSPRNRRKASDCSTATMSSARPARADGRELVGRGVVPAADAVENVRMTFEIGQDAAVHRCWTAVDQLSANTNR